MKIKTNELTDAALDWAVAKCEGMYNLDERVTPEGVRWAGGLFQPSEHWSEGGPIIEREHISTEWSSLWDCWTARDLRNAAFSFMAPHPLIAAMRCFVASRLGEEVEVPDELA